MKKFTKILYLGTAFEIEYQVLEGGDLDIDFQMTSPTGNLLFNELRSEEGLHEIASAEAGDYKVRNPKIAEKMY